MAKGREARYSSTILVGNILKTSTTKSENDKENIKTDLKDLKDVGCEDGRQVELAQGCV
jgi:hypothetical protein